MAQPTPYIKSRTFADSSTGVVYPVPASFLDQEFGLVQIAIASTDQDLKLIQRDDGALRNGIVSLDSLSASAVASLKTGGKSGALVALGNWNASTNDLGLIAGSGQNGDAYLVTVAGSANLGQAGAWSVGDIAYFVLDRWVKIPASGAVSSAAIATALASVWNIGNGSIINTTQPANARVDIIAPLNGTTYIDNVLTIQNNSVSAAGAQGNAAIRFKASVAQGNYERAAMGYSGLSASGTAFLGGNYAFVGIGDIGPPGDIYTTNFAITVNNAAGVNYFPNANYKIMDVRTDTNVVSFHDHLDNQVFVFDTEARVSTFYGPAGATYLQLIGGSTGQPFSVQAGGTDPSVLLRLADKGGAGVALVSKGNYAFTVSNPSPLAVNYATVSGSATGFSVVLGTAGADSNVNLTISPKGGGLIVTTGILYAQAEISSNYANPAWTISKLASGQANTINGATAGSLRWQILLGNSTAESGTATGSDFSIPAFANNGSFLGFGLTIERLTLNATFGGGITSSATAGVGYATGAGGTVTQATSKSTGVTLNKASGQITMNAAALAAAAKVSFVVTNSAIAATDGIHVWVASGGTANAYRASVTAVAAGSFSITVENISAGSLSEAPVIGFALIKAVTA